MNKEITWQTLIDTGVIMEDVVEEITQIIRNKKNILIAGVAGAGKTTLAHALMELVESEILTRYIEHKEHIGAPSDYSYFKLVWSEETLEEQLKNIAGVSDYIVLDGFNFTDKQVLSTWIKATDNANTGFLATYTLDNDEEQLIDNLGDSLMQLNLWDKKEVLTNTIDYIMYVRKEGKVYYMAMERVDGVINNHINTIPNKEIREYNSYRYALQLEMVSNEE